VPGRGFKRASKNAQAAGKKIRGRQMSTFAALELAYEERLYQKDGHHYLVLSGDSRLTSCSAAVIRRGYAKEL